MSKALDQILDAIEQSEGRRQRKRVVQTEDGLNLLSPSACDGCDRANVYKILGVEPTNTSDGIPAWMGTTIHEAAEEALRELDPFGETFLLEQRLPGLADRGLADGNADIIVVADKTLVDLKTVKKRDKRYFPSEGKKRQVMLYAGMARGEGIEIENVELIGLCRDGNKGDILTWESPYDPDMAAAAVEHLETLRARALAYREGDERALPRPDRPAKTFCAVYCEFYGRCKGK